MFSKRFKALQDVKVVYTDSSAELSENDALKRVFELLTSRKGIVYIIGNGGSAAVASHFSAELIKTLKIPSQTLFDISLLTCLANDLGYVESFSYPLEKLLKPEDLLIAFSGSGSSPNILRAVNAARSHSCRVITFSGCKEDNPLRKVGDLNFWANSQEPGLIETIHFFLFHAIIDLWDSFDPRIVSALSETAPC
jgi:D-sedoheptulose 7-phosphate isomerase